ncbi:class C sortase [Bifidobacterium simiiventris]|uniref:class C sortase n=1 Tax=Bifidobacterium simiiventris TaxID=2834434 RepID=UPI001C55C1B4|nr:class C sortase [Bifidobacterium simiiventris]MBW3077632.1 class C sortase [Bifidobacterium simiiventris]
MISGLSVFAWIGVTQAQSRREAEHALSHIESRRGQEYATLQRLVEDAEAYNARLARTPQVIGETADADGSASGDFSFAGDTEYHDLLDAGDSIMAALRIPKIGLLLPIRHGAGEYALANGLGHLHGTSLPVGGRSTHAVVTGHRGLADKELFTRLDELAVGDPFYIELADGRTLGYQIDGIVETEPADTDRLRIETGKDRVTLVTCTPIMLNTRRLLVTGIRASMPDIVPIPQSAPRDRRPKESTAVVAGSCAAAGWSTLWAAETRRRRRIPSRAYHMTGKEISA